MDKIPVTFNYQGKEYKGHLCTVNGTGREASFDLTVNHYHWGTLIYIKGGKSIHGPRHDVEPGWRFHSNSSRELSPQADYFGSVVSAWYEGSGQK